MIELDEEALETAMLAFDKAGRAYFSYREMMAHAIRAYLAAATPPAPALLDCPCGEYFAKDGQWHDDAPKATPPAPEYNGGGNFLEAKRREEREAATPPASRATWMKGSEYRARIKELEAALADRETDIDTSWGGR